MSIIGSKRNETAEGMQRNIIDEPDNCIYKSTPTKLVSVNELTHGRPVNVQLSGVDNSVVEVNSGKTINANYVVGQKGWCIPVETIDNYDSGVTHNDCSNESLDVCVEEVSKIGTCLNSDSLLYNAGEGLLESDTEHFLAQKFEQSTLKLNLTVKSQCEENFNSPQCKKSNLKSCFSNKVSDQKNSSLKQNKSFTELKNLFISNLVVKKELLKPKKSVTFKLPFPEQEEEIEGSSLPIRTYKSHTGIGQTIPHELPSANGSQVFVDESSSLKRHVNVSCSPTKGSIETEFDFKMARPSSGILSAPKLRAGVFSPPKLQTSILSAPKLQIPRLTNSPKEKDTLGAKFQTRRKKLTSPPSLSARGGEGLERSVENVHFKVSNSASNKEKSPGSKPLFSELPKIVNLVPTNSSDSMSVSNSKLVSESTVQQTDIKYDTKSPLNDDCLVIASRKSPILHTSALAANMNQKKEVFQLKPKKGAVTKLRQRKRSSMNASSQNMTEMDVCNTDSFSTTDLSVHLPGVKVDEAVVNCSVTDNVSAFEKDKVNETEVTTLSRQKKNVNEVCASVSETSVKFQRLRKPKQMTEYISTQYGRLGKVGKSKKVIEQKPLKSMRRNKTKMLEVIHNDQNMSVNQVTISSSKKDGHVGKNKVLEVKKPNALSDFPGNGKKDDLPSNNNGENTLTKLEVSDMQENVENEESSMINAFNAVPDKTQCNLGTNTIELMEERTSLFAVDVTQKKEVQRKDKRHLKKKKNIVHSMVPREIEESAIEFSQLKMSDVEKVIGILPEIPESNTNTENLKADVISEPLKQLFHFSRAVESGRRRYDQQSEDPSTSGKRKKSNSNKTYVMCEAPVEQSINIKTDVDQPPRETTNFTNSCTSGGQETEKVLYLFQANKRKVTESSNNILCDFQSTAAETYTTEIVSSPSNKDQGTEEEERVHLEQNPKKGNKICSQIRHNQRTYRAVFQKQEDLINSPSEFSSVNNSNATQDQENKAKSANATCTENNEDMDVGRNDHNSETVTVDKTEVEKNSRNGEYGTSNKQGNEENSHMNIRNGCVQPSTPPPTGSKFSCSEIGQSNLLMKKKSLARSISNGQRKYSNGVHRRGFSALQNKKGMKQRNMKKPSVACFGTSARYEEEANRVMTEVVKELQDIKFESELREECLTRNCYVLLKDCSLLNRKKRMCSTSRRLLPKEGRSSQNAEESLPELVNAEDDNDNWIGWDSYITDLGSGYLLVTVKDHSRTTEVVVSENVYVDLCDKVDRGTSTVDLG